MIEIAYSKTTWVSGEAPGIDADKLNNLETQYEKVITDHAGGDAKAKHTGGLGTHTHQTAGAEGGKIDHGAALNGLGDDDHGQYLKEKGSGGVAIETPAHTHADADNCGTVDHGAALTGLGDDDHTQYAKITSGTYVGNQAANKAIAHGLGRIPKIVFIQHSMAGGGISFTIYNDAGRVYHQFAAGPTSGSRDVTVPDITNFYVGDGVNHATSANDSVTYTWVAFG